MKIRLIVEVVSSEFDINGNRSHFATIISTKTGKRMCVKNLGGPSNLRFALSRTMGLTFDINYPNVYTTNSTIRRSDWKRVDRELEGVYEHQLTEEMILALEQD